MKTGQRIDIKKELECLDSQLWRHIARRCFKGWEDMREKQKELYYYTDLNALINGVFKYTDNVCIWASRWSHLNDPDEVKIGLEELRANGTPDWTVDGVFQSLKKSHSISFSGHYDILPMWKMYGNGGYGATLIFDTKVLIDEWKGLLQPCIYKNTPQFDYLKEFFFHPELHPEFAQLSSAQRTVVWFRLSTMFVSIIKANDYLYEKEFRLVGLGNEYFGDKREQKYRFSDNKIIPYVEALMPKSSLKGICLGPLVDSSNKETLEEYLQNKGFDDIVVSTSKIHYR